MRFDLLNREAVDQGMILLRFRTRLYQRLDRGWWWWCCSGCGWCGGRGIGIRACEGLGYGCRVVRGKGGGAGNRRGHGWERCGPGLRRGSGRMMAIHVPGFRGPSRDSGSPWSPWCRQLPHGLRHLRHTRIARRRLGLQRRLRRQRGRREIPGQNVFLGCRSGGLGTAPLRGFFGVHARRDQGCLVRAEAGGERSPRCHEDSLLGLGCLLGLLLVEGYHGLLGGVSVGRDRHTGGLPMEGLRLLLFGEDSLLRLLHLLLL
mmetsp:Transcript_30907/g.35707  ORF Transcript_30907/g.35707 Transcript_30907/m.35707 type:complete len:260 (-) Transcript_30907:1264-2043(-)